MNRTSLESNGVVDEALWQHLAAGFRKLGLGQKNYEEGRAAIKANTVGWRIAYVRAGWSTRMSYASGARAHPFARTSSMGVRKVWARPA
jgi:hypothetical protein